MENKLEEPDSKKTCDVNETGWCRQVFGDLLEDTSTHDVTFKTSDGGSVSGHRAIVAAGSPVFHAMLYGNMKESNEKEIELPSVDAETLKALLTFLYTGKAFFDMDNCLVLLEAANYFGVRILESRCVDCVTSTLNIENCCQIISFAHSKDFQLLMKKCFSFMSIHTIEVIRSPQFKDMSFEILLTFLESSDLHVSEIDLFLATVEWYKHQCDKLSRSENSDIERTIFQSIRYPLISKYDLIHTVKKVKEIDHSLYTLALEYHLEPEEYSGPTEQITSRQPCFEIISVTPSTVELERTKDAVVISRVGNSGWRGLCAIKVCPLEGKPIHFGLCLKNASYDLNAIQFVLRSTNPDGLNCERYSGGVNAKHMRRGENEVSVSLNSQRVTVKIGPQSLYAGSPCNGHAHYLCIYMHNSGDVIVISHMQDIYI